MAEIRDEIITLVSKLWTWVVYILLGVMGKFSYDALSGRKMSFLTSLAILGISIFVGAIISMVCAYYEVNKAAAFIVPLGTLLSEKLVISFYAYDWKGTTSDFLDYWRDKLRK